MMMTSSSTIKNTKSRWILIFICFSYLASCEVDAPMDDTILGKWSVIRAEREKVETSTLENAYFHFVNDSVMMTNIYRRDIEYPYQRSASTIKQFGEPQTTYNYSMINEDSLHMSMKIRDYKFKLFLRRDTTSSL